MQNNPSPKQKEPIPIVKQQIEFLQTKYKESQERELNLKNLNNSIMNAFGELTKESEINTKKQIAREIEIINKKKIFEIDNLKQENEKTIKTITERNLDITSRFQTLELSHKKYKDETDKKLILYENKLRENDRDIENYIFLLNKTNDDFKNFRSNSDNEIHQKYFELIKEMEKINQIHQIDKKNLENTFQNEIEALQKSHDNQITLYNSKINDIIHEKQLMASNYEKTCQLYEEYKIKLNNEINELKQQLENSHKSKENISNTQIKIKEIYKIDIQKYEKELAAYKELSKNEADEIKKLKFKNIELQNSIKNYEANEKKLKNLLNEKNMSQEDEKNELKKQLKYEKIKGDRIQEYAAQLKDEFSKKQALSLQTILEKEEEIKKLNSTIFRIKSNVSMISAKTPQKSTRLLNNEFLHQTSDLKTTKILSSIENNIKTDDLSTQEQINPLYSNNNYRKDDNIENNEEKDFFSPRYETNIKPETQNRRLDKCLSESFANLNKKKTEKKIKIARISKEKRNRVISCTIHMNLMKPIPVENEQENIVNNKTFSNSNYIVEKELKELKEEIEQNEEKHKKLYQKIFENSVKNNSLHIRSESAKSPQFTQIGKIDLNTDQNYQKDKIENTSSSNNLPSNDSPLSTKMSQFVAKNKPNFKRCISFSKKL